jgi:NADH dehydrogenase
MQGLVTVFGGSGFVGAQVVRALAKSRSARHGVRVRVAVRNVGRGYRLRMLGDVGQIEIVQANIRDRDSIARALEGAQAAINLTGVLYESGRQSFESVHVDGARNVAAAAKSAGVSGFVQMSALGADPASPSLYARTKAAGEAAVREIHPRAAIIRPSIVFGQEDNFFNRFAAMAAMSPALPLIGGGHTRFQPVYVGDVAEAIARVTRDVSLQGVTYELGGPGTYSFRELMELVLRETLRRRILVPVPFGVARLMGKVAQLSAFAIAPPITADQVELLKADNVVSGAAPGLTELGVQPTALESILPTYLYRFRRGGQFAEAAAEA